MSEEKRYNLAQILFNDTEIRTDKFKVTRKQEADEYTATNSHSPYALSFNTETFEYELTDVDPLQRSVFKEMMVSQQEHPNELPMIATYDFNEITGDLIEDDVFYDCYITEISKENANDPFSVKGSALRIKK